MELQETIRKDLTDYLRSVGMLGDRFPECPDVEELWRPVCEAYLPDGIREFNHYPTVSLGWLMFVGIALAYRWDTDWEACAGRSGAELYHEIRDARGYDKLDEYVLDDLLKLDTEEADKVTKIVGEAASRTLRTIRAAAIEPGTPEAMRAYLAGLHELYIAGMAMELHRLGYRMTPLGQ